MNVTDGQFFFSRLQIDWLRLGIIGNFQIGSFWSTSSLGINNSKSATSAVSSSLFVPKGNNPSFFAFPSREHSTRNKTVAENAAVKWE